METYVRALGWTAVMCLLKLACGDHVSFTKYHQGTTTGLQEFFGRHTTPSLHLTMGINYQGTGGGGGGAKKN